MIRKHAALAALAAIAASAPAHAAVTISSAVPMPGDNPHACGTEWYPPAALAAGEEGKTTLSFRIGVDGIPKNVSVAASSGYADLDEAATKCVATWKYQPAMVASNPVEADWKSTVEWSMPPGKILDLQVSRGGPIRVVPAAQQPIGNRVCQNPMKPPAPLGKISRVMFWVLPDGSITHRKLVVSSGDERLDDLALTCAAQWRYTPLNGGSSRHVMVAFVSVPW